MKIYTRLVLDMETGAVIESESYDYDGPVALCCGASSQQTDTYNQQSQLSSQVMNQAQTVFGSASSVFNDLVSSLAPTVAAGPNQEGFSAAEKSALNSAAITNSGTAYRNAKAATGNALAAQNGGNAATTGGTTAGIDENLAASSAENTSDQLNKIDQEDYEVGRQNYDKAVGGLQGSTQVFNPATGLDNSAANALEGQANTANQMAQQDNSWVQAVTGALGGVAGAATSAGFSKLTGGGSGTKPGNSTN